MLVREANESRRQLENDINKAEAREKSETVRRQERNIKETLDKYKQIKEN